MIARQTLRRSTKKSDNMLFALVHTQPKQSLPTFYFQESLPRLPLPSLEQTLSKYLRSLEPILWLQQKSGGEPMSNALALRQKWAREFETGIGNVCQQRLQELEKKSRYNWFDDSFWLKRAYLESRQPLLVNSNWWLALQDDPKVPEDVRLAQNPRPLNSWQLRRAAWIIKRMLAFKERLDKQHIPPDMTRSAGLCMSHYTRMFNMTRIPVLSCDRLHQASTADPGSNQILVMIQDHFYLINPYDHNHNFVGVTNIITQLEACVANASSSPKATPLSILTADNRDSWAKNRSHLVSLSSNNQANLSKIDSTLFALSLDPTTSYSDENSPLFTNPRHDSHLHHTAFGESAHNRWYDKAISIFIESNTRFGMMGEHSPCDALIPSVLGDYCVEAPMNLEEFSDASSLTPIWQKLNWDLDNHLEQECQRVERQCKQTIEDSDDSQLWFDDYGVDWIRNMAKLSPDAYIQMALQFAWYKNQGKFTAVYETASTRMFLHGRTDVIRSFSRESLAFILSMIDNGCSDSKRLGALEQAIKAHNAYTRDASLGRGIDRHFMALRLVMGNNETASIFEDPLFAESQTWKLSTSGLSSGDRFIGTGFGSPYPDGYGINYLAGGDILKFGIESKRSCNTTSTQKFKKNLVESLRDMRLMIEQGIIETDSYNNNMEQPQARL